VTFSASCPKNSPFFLPPPKENTYATRMPYGGSKTSTLSQRANEETSKEEKAAAKKGVAKNSKAHPPMF